MTTKFTLSTSGKIAAALALFYGCTIPSAFADIQSADSHTQIQRIAGVEVINIAKPSESGLSHNKYNKYNVDTKGAVLNNALVDGKSVLAGKLNKNSQLENKAATVILNEVVKRRSRSTLAGKQEIFGQQADYVLANPNGISCDGCGFINTPRASLVVGKPIVTEGKLTGYQVSGDKQLSTSGKITQSESEQLDFIAPTINISGDLSGGKINVVMGNNTIHRDSQGVLTVQKSGQSILDGKIAGSIQAGRIRIHSTDDFATLHMQGATLASKDMVISAGNAKVDGTITEQYNRRDDVWFDNKTGAKVVASRTTNNGTYKKSKIQSDKLTFQVKNKLTLTGADIDAKVGELAAGEIKFGTQRTEDYLRIGKDQTKGQWLRHEVDDDKQQTIHRTTLNVDNLRLIANEGKISGDAVKINTASGLIYGKNGIDLKGISQTRVSNSIADFKLETARLKTGHSYQNAETSELIQSELNIKDKLILAGQGDITLAAVKGNIDGKLLIKNTGKTTFTTQAVQNTYKLDDQQKFWGGIAGSKTLGKGRTENVQYGSDFTIKGFTYIDSQGAQIKGSRLLASEGYINANKHNIDIDSAMNQLTEHSNQRTGTIFDITKERKNSFSHISTSQGSEIKSKTNLALISEKDLNVIGSQISALGVLSLGIKGDTNLSAAENYIHKTEHQSGFNLSAKVEKPTITLDEKPIIDGVVNGIKDQNLTADSATNLLKNNLKFNVEGSATLGIYDKKQESHATTHTSTTIEGKSVEIATDNLNVTGSNVNATDGDLTIKANNVNTEAALDHLTKNEKEATAGITGKVQLTENSLTGSVNVGIQHKNQQTDTQTAQSSTLKAKNNLNIHANTITHKGSQLIAGNNVNENAENIDHTTAQNSTHTKTQSIDTGATLKVSVDKEKMLSGSTEISAEGNKQTSQTVNHQTTTIQAGNDIAVKGKNLNDNATQYQAGNNINATSQNHNANAVYDQKNNQSTSAGAHVGVDVSTKDMQTFDVKANIGGKYQQDKSSSSTAQKANFNAGNNIAIDTQKFNSQADLQAGGNVDVNATEEANFNQATNNKTHSGGGFKANVGAGALVVPQANAAIPSLDFDVSANGNSGQSENAVTSTIKGKNIAITSEGTTTLQGTNIHAEQNANIAGNKVNIEAGHSSVKEANGNVSAGVGIGSELSSLKLNLGVQAEHENSNSHTTSNVIAQNLSITSKQGTKLQGTNVESTNLNLDTGKGNLDLTATNDHTSKTNVGINLSLSGKIDDKQWKPNSGSAGLNVNVIRNETHTGTSINSQNTHLNVGNDTNVVGSQLTSESTSGTVYGNVNLQTLSNKISETNVSLSANGSGKFAPYQKDKWQESAKKDWDNGTIAGVKAGIKAKVHVNKQATNQKAEFIHKTRQPTIKGSVKNLRVPSEHSRQIAFSTNSNTRLKEMMNKAINAHQTRK
ncbi:hypothetical protein A6B43_04970 [Vespertiliibacter pulmonis]|uniref:S-PFT family hemolysin n=1 Tax=Vespertiliibacter pulmonis TaxID=1443036 RepID=A0A3N4VUB8_9PAST|nr:hemagglutinin repeat-containing protein [Vespertiliibacter pulmonis]QLB20922.1 hypothetical protein A6B43_04970 [Vespertiliibacter pulmonis]RPE83579.1 S-PFT family hemolysin [Vespertiliibacter pulmonis]